MKDGIIQNILKNPVYQTNSALYQGLVKALGKLSMSDLRALDTVTNLERLRIHESHRNTKAAPKIQMVHNTDAAEPIKIRAYCHCTKCLEELPADQTPAEWARTQTGWTDDGFQIVCVRHACNVDKVTVQVKGAA